MGSLSLSSIHPWLTKDAASLIGSRQELQNGTLAGMSRDRATTAAGGVVFDLFQAQSQEVSLAVRLQQARAALASEDGGQTTQVDSRQMTFEFYGEVRTEELARYQSRTDAVAQGLGGSTRETYIEASRKVAARFQMSITISGAALESFAGASEKLSDSGTDAIAQLLGFAQDALKSSDDIVNEIFKMLSGFMNGADDAEDAFKKFMQQLFGSGYLGGGTDAKPLPANGVQASVSGVQLEFQFEFSSETHIQIQQTEVQQSDPITFDLNGNGIELTSYRNGAAFDITGTGRIANTAFVTGGDAFLAIDRNGNGIIDSGKELFGDQNRAKNGYAELAKLDSNRDGVINKFDASFDALVLFKDNGNGKTEPGELISLKDARITEIDLTYREAHVQASGGNTLGQVATYRRADGSTGMTADSILNYTA